MGLLFQEASRNSNAKHSQAQVEVGLTDAPRVVDAVPSAPGLVFDEGAFEYVLADIADVLRGLESARIENVPKLG